MAARVSGRKLDSIDLIEQLGDGIFAIDRERRIELFNRAAEELYGYSAAEVVGRKLDLLIPPEVSELAAGELERVFNGETRRVDGHLLTRRSQVVGVSLTLTPLRDRAGTVVGAAAVIRDISQRSLRERQHELVARLASETETVAVMATDRDGLMTVFNRGAEELLGYSARETVGQLNGLALFDADELERRSQANGGKSAFVRAQAGEVDEGVWTLKRKDGSKLPVLLTIRSVSSQLGEVEGFVAFARDLSALRDAELARMQAEERFRIAFEHAPIGLAITSVEGPTAGHWMQTNPALARMLGWEPGELDGRAINELTHPDDRAHTAGFMADLRQDRPVVIEKRFVRRDGSVVWAFVTSTPVPSLHGTPPSYSVSQFLDISDRKQFEHQLHYLAEHDPLTGMHNRHRFEAELEHVAEEARAAGCWAALLVLDLDGFKVANDRFGHAVGDDLISHVGRLLRQTVRKTDFTARLGGDEFAVILRGCATPEATRIAEKVLEAIRSRGFVVTPDGKARVTASIGVAMYAPGCNLTADEWAVGADSAMYDAKADGRNRYALHSRDGERRAPVPERDSWYSRLRRALDEDRFVLHAQPILPICGAGMPRYELLVRMVDESGEVIPPGAFLLNAERFDLIGEIDRWVMRRAIALLHEHSLAGNDISLSVNLSGRTMNDLGLVHELGEMLETMPVPPARLVVEVTETAAIVNIERARELARQLRQLGCLFALDDFGSGFSSFYYLKHLEFDYLKIDGEFIVNLVGTETDQLLVKAVVDIARGLGTQTVAEFVGDEATLAMLRKLRVDFGQGFHLGRPVPVDETLPPLPGAATPVPPAQP